jgi:hypothetical protein
MRSMTAPERAPREQAALLGVVLTLATLLMVRCASQTAPAPHAPVAAGPAAGASASAAPLPSASAPASASATTSSPAPPGKPPRPVLTDAAARLKEELLRDVCNLTYRARRGGGYGIGCSDPNQLSEEQEISGDFSVSPLDAACLADPTCNGEFPLWEAIDVIRGSFSGKGLDEAVITMAGAANAKHSGYVFLRREDKRWKVVSNSFVGDLGECRVFRRDDGRDLLVCVASNWYLSGLYEGGMVVGLKHDDPQAGSLFSIPHGDAKALCLPPAARKAALSSRAAAQPWFSDVFIASSEAIDTNRDGRTDLVVHIDEKRLPIATARESNFDLQPLRESGEVWAKRRLVFINNGSTLAPDAATRATLRRWCPDPKRP